MQDFSLSPHEPNLDDDKDSFSLNFNVLGRLELTLQSHKQIGPKCTALSS